MKKLLISLLILATYGAYAQDTQQTHTQQPRALVEVFKEKAEQDKLIKQVRTTERDQQTVFKNFKAIYASSKASLKSNIEFKRIMLGITALSAIGGIVALAHYFIYADHSNLTLF